jgi:UDP-N-acetylmuramyl pentapeptide synthase
MFDQKKAVVMPSLIELGKSSKEMHYKIGKKIGETCGLAVIYSRDYFKEIKKGALESGMKKDQMVCLKNNKKITRLLSDYLVAGDVLLLEGRLPAALIDLLKEEKSREQ